MKKTYVTTMPDHVGAFLNASRTIAGLGLNITRVSYNKAVDMHTLFIECEGSAEQIAMADHALNEIGYLQSNQAHQDVLLLEFRLRDVPGSVTEILELIREFNFNISYISSQENGSDYQLFKMGLFVEDSDKMQHFLMRAEEKCRVRVIDYNRVEKSFDNSIFYRSYADELCRCMDLGEKEREQLLINANLAKRLLDKLGTHRFLFGSDFPMWTPKTELERFLSTPLGLSEREKEDILYHNFARLFGLGEAE